MPAGETDMRITPTASLAALLATTALACTSPAANPNPPVAVAQPAAPGTERLTVFISDLHISVGRDAHGTWHPYEDFRWEREFVLFLDRVNREGEGRTDLILNGDTFELWQSLPQDCVYPDRNLGCTEADALRHIGRVLSEHNRELKALAAFATSGSNTVTIVPGNHDAALLFPAVAHAVLAKLPAPAGRVRILTSGYWLSPDGLVYAEHGHQIGKEVNWFEDWPQPFLSGPGGRHLRRPWGEQFVQSYYNRWEAKYPIIDNISNERVGMRYAMAAEGALRSALASADFMRFFLLGVSLRQFGQALGEDGRTPAWDITRIRRDGDRFLIESFPEGDPLRAEAARAGGEQRLPLSVRDLLDAEIRAICDQRALHAEQYKATPDPRFNVTRCPTTGEGLGAIAQYLLASRDEVFSMHLKKISNALGQRERRFALFVYSHTHQVDAGFEPLARENIGWNPRVVNTGAWQRVVSPATLAKENLPDNVVLQKTVESLPACYSMVWVGPYATMPAAKIRSWRQQADGVWDFGPMCEG